MFIVCKLWFVFVGGVLFIVVFMFGGCVSSNLFDVFFEDLGFGGGDMIVIGL